MDRIFIKLLFYRAGIRELMFVRVVIIFTLAVAVVAVQAVHTWGDIAMELSSGSDVQKNDKMLLTLE